MVPPCFFNGIEISIENNGIPPIFVFFYILTQIHLIICIQTLLRLVSLDVHTHSPANSFVLQVFEKSYRFHVLDQVYIWYLRRLVVLLSEKA